MWLPRVSRVHERILGFTSDRILATKATVTKPAGMQTIHAQTHTQHYYRFEPGLVDENLQNTTDDNSDFSTTSVTFSAGSGTITPTFPSGMKQLHITLTNGHYYRFEATGQVTALQGGDVTGSFTTISFTTS